MATLEIRGYVNRLVLKDGPRGPYAKFDLGCQQKRKDRDGKPVVDKLSVRVVDFDPKDLPAEGDYVGVTGYVTITAVLKDGRVFQNIDLTAKSYEKMEQKTRAAPAAAPSHIPADPFGLDP